MKKTKTFLASLIIGLATTIIMVILSNTLDSIITNNFINNHGSLIDGVWYPNGSEYDTLRRIWFCLDLFKFSAIIFIGFAIYFKLIRKTNIPLLTVVLFSIGSGLINSIVCYLFHLDYIISYLVNFIIATVCMLIALNKTEKTKKIIEEREEGNMNNPKKRKYYPSFWVIVIIGYIIFTATSVCIIGFINKWNYRVESIFGLIFANMLFSIIYTYLYFLPYLIANKKNHLQTRAIYILNIFAGWTLIAWIISLIWSCTEANDKKIIQQTIQISNADELLKYKKLLDDGIITEEEFEGKKKKLLNS